MKDQGVEVQFLELPGTRLELLAPLDETSRITGFLEKRGPGLHHICYEVSDIAAVLLRLTKEGMQAIDAVPRPGAEDKLVAFLHPASADGVLIELQQA